MDKISIMTPEQIELEYDLAGVGSRFLAVLIDHIIQFIIVVILTIVALAAYPNVQSMSFVDFFRSTILAFLSILAFLDIFAYFIFFETVWAGQTPGKKIIQVQVVKDNGEPVGFIEALLRNIFRIIDILIGNYLVGGIIMIVHAKRKRLGDIVANTVVVKMKQQTTLQTLQEVNIKSDLEINVIPLDETDYSLARNFLIRRQQLPLQHRGRIADKIANTLKSKIDMQLQDIDNEEFIELVASEYRKKKILL